MSDKKCKTRIAWWNTGLSPSKGQRKHNLTKQILIVVEELFNNKMIDLVVLAEVSPDDIIWLAQNLSISVRTIVEDDRKVGIGVLYRSENISISDPFPVRLTCKFNENDLTKMLRISFVSHGRHKVTLYMCHWPSRLKDDVNRPKREELAKFLRSQIDSDLEKAQQENHLLVIGDFNAEPFDKELSEILKTSRDRKKVVKKRSLLYNPFWRALGERTTDLNRSPRFSVGTYFYDDHWLTTGFLFDQAMVSSSLVTGTDFILNEDETQIYETEQLASKNFSGIAKGFDHLPIVVSLQAQMVKG
ncbi:endonuclease/exonuclease/phosphatase family protein [Lacunimicrobium album]